MTVHTNDNWHEFQRLASHFRILRELQACRDRCARTLSRCHGRKLYALRFHPNILVDAGETGPFPEDDWVGKRIAFGTSPISPVLTVTDKDIRCSMINLDPSSAESDPSILKCVVKRRDNLAGVYVVPTRLGSLEVGITAYCLD